jgi:hypothetical protein
MRLSGTPIFRRFAGNNGWPFERRERRLQRVAAWRAGA